MKIPIFPGKYHQNGGFSMAMLVYRSVTHTPSPTSEDPKKESLHASPGPARSDAWSEGSQVDEGTRDSTGALIQR